MYDIISELITNLEEKQIELLLLTFRTVGFNLRKDNPIALKNLILKVQELVNNIKDQDNRYNMIQFYFSPTIYNYFL